MFKLILRFLGFIPLKFGVLESSFQVNQRIIQKSNILKLLLSIFSESLFQSLLQESMLKITAHYKVTVWSLFYLWQFLLKSIPLSHMMKITGHFKVTLMSFYAKLSIAIHIQLNLCITTSHGRMQKWVYRTKSISHIFLYKHLCDIYLSNMNCISVIFQYFKAFFTLQDSVRDFCTHICFNVGLGINII